MTLVFAYVRTHAVDNNTFLDAFSFFTGPDPTHGYVKFVSRDEALSSSLLSLSEGTVRMAAETTDTSSPRRSIRVQSKALFSGAIFIIDLNHIPTGCGTWPAFWSVGPNWPSAGEIDILEGVHRSTHDQTTLHTSTGCGMAHSSTLFTGRWGTNKVGKPSTDCFVGDPKQYANAGCAIIDDDAASFGAPFNARGGGVVATVWDRRGIRTYRWARGAVPSALAARKPPREADWGLPYARFDFGPGCDAGHFHSHQIVFDLTLCGDWAGGTFASQCADVAKGASCEAFVSRGANMMEAYWDVNYVDVWENASTAEQPPQREPVATVGPAGHFFHGTTDRGHYVTK